MLRDTLINWLKGNCPIKQARGDVLRLFDEHTKRGNNSHFVLGAELTVRHRPFLVHCFDDEFFAFELTEAQCAHLEVPANQMRPYAAPASRIARGPGTVIHLDRIEIANAGRLNPEAPIHCHLEYAANFSSGAPDGFLWAGCITHQQSNGAQVSAFSYPYGPVCHNGKLDLQFPPLSNNGALSVPNPVVLFVQICLVSDTRKGIPSHARGGFGQNLWNAGFPMSSFPSNSGFPGCVPPVHAMDTPLHFAISDIRAVLVDLDLQQNLIS